MNDTSRQTQHGRLSEHPTSKMILSSSNQASADREGAACKADAIEEPDRTIIGRIGALLVGARLGRGVVLQEVPGALKANGPLELHDEAGAVRFTVSLSIDGVLFEGTSRFRGMAGQFSGTIRRAEAVGVSRYALEYSDPDCCGTYMSFTIDDRTGEILSIEPPEVDWRDLIVLPALADTEARQEADDAHRLEQI